MTMHSRGLPLMASYHLTSPVFSLMQNECSLQTEIFVSSHLDCCFWLFLRKLRAIWAKQQSNDARDAVTH
jgi:hypothetical protein